MSTYTLCLTSPAAAVTAAADPNAPAGQTDRVLSGLGIPYGPIGKTSAGPVTVAAGALTWPEDLRRVKLFTEHGRATPVGYAIEAADTDAGSHWRFRVGNTPAGDAALLEAAEGIRDALSVELDDVTIVNGAVTAGTVAAFALVPLPAWADARLAASRHPEGGETVPPQQPEQPDPAGPGPSPDPEPDPTDPPEPDPTTEQETTVTTTTTTAGPPADTLQAAAASLNPVALAGAAGPASITAAASSVAGAMRAANGSAAALEAALTDITPAASGDAFMRPAWLGELWTPRATQRDWMDLIGTKPLTSMTWDGWKWQTYPEVDDYEGNKKPIPSSPAKIVPASGTATRIAGGWDVDRIYEDFNTGFIAALLEAATVDYALKSETKLAAALLDEATPAAGGADTVTAALSLIVTTLINAGARLSGVGMAADVFADFIELPADQVPWWLKGQAVVNISDVSVSIGGIRVFANHSLPAGTMLGADKRAIDFRETGPFRLQALNLPNGGIDVAVMGYQGQIVHDSRGIVSVELGASGGTGATSAGDDLTPAQKRAATIAANKAATDPAATAP